MEIAMVTVMLILIVRVISYASDVEVVNSHPFLAVLKLEEQVMIIVSTVHQIPCSMLGITLGLVATDFAMETVM